MTYLLLSLSLQIAAAVSPVPSATAGAKIAYIQDKEVVVGSDSGGHVRQITHDGVAKTLPVWSKDGVVIAFIETSSAAGPLGKMLVVNQSGEVLHQVPLHSDTPAGGMRFVESLEWLDGGRMAISGSANPSLTETAIVDLATGRQEFGIYDDGPGADFSPDGAHLAVTSGAPHFTPASEREAAVEIDFRRVFPPAGEQVEILSRRSWSPDNHRVAFLAQKSGGRRPWMVVAHLNGTFVRRDIELPAGAQCTPVWTAREPIAVCEQHGSATWVAPTGSDSAHQGDAEILFQALDQGRQLVNKLEVQGVREADIWFASGPLRTFARKVTIPSR